MGNGEFYTNYKGQLHDRLVSQISSVYETMHTTPLDPRIIHAFRTIPRHPFAPGNSFARVYRNKIVPIELDMIEYRIENSGIPLDKEKISDDKMVTIRSIFNECNATNSEPALIGYMVQQVLPENDMPGQELTALEVGCGTGYVVKILREVGFQHVVGIERKPHLAEKARALLSDDPQVVIICQDGKAGLPDKKFDAIIVSALVTDSDVLSTLISQLKDKNSKLVLPIALSLLAEKDIIPKRVFEETNSDPREGVLYVGNKGENGRFALAPKIPVQFVYLD